jgi:hypothetical protein
VLATPRVAYLDRLKVGLVAVITGVHGVAGCTGFEGAWPYQPVRQVGLPDAVDKAFGTLVLPNMLFVMGLFFLMSGLVTPRSLARKGPGRFARDRLLRLGILVSSGAGRHPPPLRRRCPGHFRRLLSADGRPPPMTWCAPRA